jgi:hypothetical protein
LSNRIARIVVMTPYGLAEVTDGFDGYASAFAPKLATRQRPSKALRMRIRDTLVLRRIRRDNSMPRGA